MRSGAAAGHTGYFHEAAFYGSDDELLSVVVPFVEGGVAAGEPTIVALTARNAELVRAALGPAPVTYADPSCYTRPASTILEYRDLCTALVDAGARQIRVVGDVPHSGTGADWPTWLRYEGAINRALDGFPLWGLCPYDTRLTPDDVLADVERLHPHLASTTGSHHRNERFTEPGPYVLDRLRGGPAAVGAQEPRLVLHDVTSPRAVRAALRALASEAFVDDERLDDLVVSASEVVTNALVHGLPPVDVRVTIGDGELACEVRDAGTGVTNPFLGLTEPPHGSEGGFGLWMAHQVCDRVDLDLTDGGFGIRLVVGR